MFEIHLVLYLNPKLSRKRARACASGSAGHQQGTRGRRAGALCDARADTDTPRAPAGRRPPPARRRCGCGAFS